MAAPEEAGVAPMGAPAQAQEPVQARGADGQDAADAAGGKKDGGRFSNAIPLPKRGKQSAGITNARKKKRRRRIRVLVVVAIVAVVVLVYASGVYLTAFSLLGDWTDGIRLALRPGEGFPMSYALTGFVKAEPMGDKGFAVLGERDLSIVSDSGVEHRVQHAYPDAGLAAGDTRAVVYSRGGKEFFVENRSQMLVRQSTEQDIQFASMSPAGWLAVATASRYRATLAVYGPDYNMADPMLSLTLVDEQPALASFAGDNRTLLLGCYSAKDGALGTSIHLLRTGNDSILATVRVENAQLLKAEFISNSRFLAVYDSFVALYNTAGEELARYDYGGLSLMTADITDGHCALVLGSSAQETLHAVLLDGSLAALCNVSATTGGTVRILAAADGFYLLSGQDVYAYTAAGLLAGTLALEERAFTLVQGGQPLVVTAASVRPLQGLLHPEAVQSSQGAASQGDSSTGSASGAGQSVSALAG